MLDDVIFHELKVLFFGVDLIVFKELVDFDGRKQFARLNSANARKIGIRASFRRRHAPRHRDGRSSRRGSRDHRRRAELLRLFMLRGVLRVEHAVLVHLEFDAVFSHYSRVKQARERRQNGHHAESYAVSSEHTEKSAPEEIPFPERHEKSDDEPGEDDKEKYLPDRKEYRGILDKTHFVFPSVFPVAVKSDAVADLFTSTGIAAGFFFSSSAFPTVYLPRRRDTARGAFPPFR